jgi:hypothetical protein
VNCEVDGHIAAFSSSKRFDEFDDNSMMDRTTPAGTAERVGGATGGDAPGMEPADRPAASDRLDLVGPAPVDGLATEAEDAYPDAVRRR